MAWTIRETIPAISSLLFFFFLMWHLQKKWATAIYAKQQFRHKPYTGREALAQVKLVPRSVPGDVVTALLARQPKPCQQLTTWQSASRPTPTSCRWPRAG
jgi:hypothetical protein